MMECGPPPLVDRRQINMSVHHHRDKRPHPVSCRPVLLTERRRASNETVASGLGLTEPSRPERFEKNTGAFYIKYGCILLKFHKIRVHVTEIP